MHYIFEAILVGIYSVIIYFLLSVFITNQYLQLFTVGFLKHILGGYLKLHDFYCNYKYPYYKYGKFNFNKNLLFIESIFEGILYLIFGFILIELISMKNIYLYFLIGFLLHIIFEILKIHNIFCKIKFIKN
jgi:hypothetical protein